MKILRFIERQPHWLFLAIACWLGAPVVSTAANLLVTNLVQLQESLAGQAKVTVSVSLKATICAVSRPAVGAVILQDGSGVELLQIDKCPAELHCGDEILIEAAHCMLRQREAGVEISGMPVVDNDGLHDPVDQRGAITLAAGRHRFQLDWFNSVLRSKLQVACEEPETSLQIIPAARWWHDDDSRSTNLIAGLRVAAFEGSWESIPDFDWLTPVKKCVVTTIDLECCTRPDHQGLRFSGWFEAPRAGKYTFKISSADGAMLFVGDDRPTIQVLAQAPAPPALPATVGEVMTNQNVGRWLAVEGRVSFASTSGQGLELELRSGTGVLQVQVADAAGCDPAKLFHARIRARGLGKRILTLENKSMLGRLFVASANDLEILETAAQSSPSLLTTAEQIQRLQPAAAETHLPVRIRGVVTSVTPKAYHGFSVQDDTRGVYVNLSGLTNYLVPRSGQLWEILGHTVPGDFAPVVFAEELKEIGPGQLPEPVHPTWSQLINGSLDVQWVEIQGVVVALHGKELTLLRPEGKIQVSFDYENPIRLEQFLDCQVSIRGTLFAEWNGNTHEVQPGQIFMRNARVNVDRSAPPNAFGDPLKTARELLQFDMQAAALQRIRVRGQVIHAETQQIFVNDEKTGLRILPVQTVSLQPGDLVEAAGYPEIGGAAPVLHEALVRKIGAAPLPPPRILSQNDLAEPGLDATRVQLEAVLLNRRVERAGVVLEMQAGLRPFLARGKGNAETFSSLRKGSRLELTGVYASLRPRGEAEGALDSFEILLNAPSAIKILSQPPWWTLQRSLAAVGALSLVLSLVALWVFQLRRQVYMQTKIIREKAEREVKLEERARIARDLHDDLGASLTEITVLASTGLLRASESAGKTPDCFQSICDKSRQLVTALDAIVWAIDPEKNTLQSLADYLAGHVGDYLSTTGITCRYKLPVELPPQTLDGKVRHELFLAVKEALHNVVQHAQADAVEFEMAVTEGKLEIGVTDNGCGFEPAVVGSKGHGLKNYAERMARVGGESLVTARPGGGTSVRLKIPLPARPKIAAEAMA